MADYKADNNNNTDNHSSNNNDGNGNDGISAAAKRRARRAAGEKKRNDNITKALRLAGMLLIYYSYIMHVGADIRLILSNLAVCYVPNRNPWINECSCIIAKEKCSRQSISVSNSGS
jgi:hypothetical protein